MVKTCSIDGCEKASPQSTVCSMHRQRKWRYGSYDTRKQIRGDDKARFFSHVMKNDKSDCWLWTASLSGGYGVFTVHGSWGSAHRWSYEYHKGSIPPGLHIDHLCRNRRCVNPNHLEAVTQRENNVRRAKAQTTKPRGRSKLTDTQRFWSFVEIVDGCWVWTRPHADGYGRFSFKGKPWLAHRWSVSYFEGCNPEGMDVDHVCQNKACVNPAHLDVVTRAEHNQRTRSRAAR